MSEPQRPIFVVGVGRSGTTLLSAILDTHPDIAIGPESHYLTYWIRAYRHLDVSRPDQFAAFWSDFISNNHFRRWAVSADSVRARIERQPVVSFRAIFAALLEEYRVACGKRRVGEKTPVHDLHMAQLLEWFPDAQIVYLLRDPRAVAASMVRVPWADPNIDVHARRWRRSVAEVGARALDPRITIVRYEELVNRPAETLKVLCEFLGEQFREGMLSPERSGGPLAGGEWWKEEARGPITPGSVNRWRHELGETDIAVVEDIAGPLMVKLGYACEGRRLSVHERALVLVRAAVRRLRRGFGRMSPPRPWSLVADPRPAGGSASAGGQGHKHEAG